MVRLLDTGVLLIGESGIGKSEGARELVTKGHQLVADVVVEVIVAEEGLLGRAPALTFELLEIRGLGIINVRELFGQFAACSESEIDLCIELRKWSEMERIENVIKKHEIAGYAIPKFILPVSSGRSLSTLVEVGARLFRNRETGSDATRVLLEKHEALLNPIR